MNTRYYFDLIEGDFICSDDEGTEFATMGDAIEEAIRSLGDFARDRGRSVSVEVRDNVGLVVRCDVRLEMMRSAAA